MSITQDPTSGWYVPANASEWTALLAGTGISNPTSCWQCQDASGGLADSIGSQAFTDAGGTSFQVGVSGWSRKAITLAATGGGGLETTAGPMGDPYTASHLLVAIFYQTGAWSNGSNGDMMGLGGGASYRGAQIKASTSVLHFQPNDGSAQADGSSSIYGAGAAHLGALQVDLTDALARFVTDVETISQSPYTAPPSANLLMTLGAAVSLEGPFGFLFIVGWRGSSSELSSAELATLFQLIKTGPISAFSSIAVTPSSSAGNPGNVIVLDAVGTLVAGGTQDVTATATWTTSDPTIAQVNSVGVVTCIGAGTATITATQSSVSGNATFTVTNYVAPEPTPTFAIVVRPVPSSGPNNIMLTPGTSASSSSSSDPNGQPNPAPTPNSPAPTDASANPGRTIDALNNGSAAIRYVVAIEGYPFLLTDADPAKAVIAWSDTDWTQALDGLFVALDNQQQLDPWTPFQRGGQCSLSVLPDAADRFGIDVNRAADGAQAGLVLPCDRYGTPAELAQQISNGIIAGGGSSAPTTLDQLYIDNATDFVAGDVHIGTECISVSAPNGTGTFMDTYARGKYSPFGSGGAGGHNFAQHHRVTTDPQGVLLNPVVSQQPRIWIGRWVGVWMHTVDGNGTLNARKDAQVVYAGQIASITDDADTGCTVVELQHVLDVVQSITLGRDMFSAVIPNGWYITAGQQFSFSEGATTGHNATANPLVVVASGASGTNQINAGYYALEDICAFLNAWLAAELLATRIAGIYTWSSPVPGDGALRTKCYWLFAAATSVQVAWNLTMDGGLFAYLGLSNALDDAFSTIAATGTAGGFGFAGTSNIFQSDYSPWRIIGFRNQNSNASLDVTLNVTSCIGTIVDQWAQIPSGNRPPQEGLLWGVFLMNEQFLMTASFDRQGTSTTLSNCLVQQYIVPGVQAGATNVNSFGTKAGDTNDTVPITVRQVFLFEDTCNTLVKSFFYGSGSNGYNSPTFDTLGYGLGIAIPGDLLGAPFETSVDNLPGFLAPMVCVIDEPTKLSDLLSADMVLRHAFPMWRADAGVNGNGGLVFGRWQTPLTQSAVAALTEDNKAETTGNVVNHRTPTMLDATWVKAIIKVDFDRDFTVSKDGNYQSTMTFEDETAVDDAGGAVDPFTISARNTYSQFLGTGAGIESISAVFLDILPLFTRPLRKATRSADQTLWESVHVGDIVLIDDTFMRDPATGTRGISGREALVTRTRYNPGGATPSGGITPQAGEVDIAFVDNHHFGPYAPGALVNTLAGQNGVDPVLRLLHVQSHAFSMSTETEDWRSFAVHDRIRITERDPADPNNPSTFQAEILAIAGETSYDANGQPVPGGVFALDRSVGPLTAPYYMVTYDRYDQVAGLQQAKSYLAALATNRIENIAQPYQLAATNEPNATTANADVAELIPASAYLDGAPMDIPTELAIARTLNVIIDSKTAHQSPALGTMQNWASSITNIQGAWYPIFISPMFLGLDAPNVTIARFLEVAPCYKAAFVGDQIRVTLARTFPALASGSSTTGTPVLQYNGVFDQVTWVENNPSNVNVNINLAALIIPTPQFLAATVKDPTTGIAWLVIETNGAISTSGLALCRETARIPKASIGNGGLSNGIHIFGGSV